MARPSWLPAALIAGIRDFVPEYVRTFPAFLPRRYTRKGAQIYAEFEALGEGLAYFREALEWLLRTFFPQDDVEALWLSRHERDYALPGTGGLTDEGITLRQRAIIAAMRNRGTATKGRVQAIMASIFDVPASDIGFAVSDVAGNDYSSLNPSEVDWHKAVDAYSILVYHLLESANPNRAQAEDAINKLSQSGERWFVNRAQFALFDTEGAGFGSAFS